MRPLEVDADALLAFAATVVVLARRLEDAGAVLGPAARATGADGLVAQVARRTSLVSRLRDLARVAATAGHAYAVAEAAIAGSFGTAGRRAAASGWGDVSAVGVDDPRVVRLLAQLPPSDLRSLLEASPALAAVVVASADGRIATHDGATLADLLQGKGSAAGLGGDQAVGAFLTGLGEERLLLLALLQPSLVAGARAAPPQARYVANRVLVSADLHHLLTRLGTTPPGATRERIGRAVAQRREWLAGRIVLRRPDGSVVRQPHQLLRFDPRGDGEVVEVLGDLDRARHLTVFVPGTGSDLHRYRGTLARMVPFAAAAPHLALVVWQGADFPDQPFDDGVLPVREHVVAAAYRDAADRAGPALAADVAGLVVAAPHAGRDVTVLGHSYGGSIVGSAVQHGLAADRVVHVASAGTYTEHPAGRGPRLFSMTAPDDPIQLSQGHDLRDAPQWLATVSPPAVAPLALPVGAALRGLVPPGQVGHGADPDTAPGVVRLDTGRFDDSCRLVRGHSGMFTPGSTAWRNLLATMTAEPVQVLETQRWSTHLQPWSVRPGLVPHWQPPRYVLDRSPWSDPAYQAPTRPSG